MAKFKIKYVKFVFTPKARQGDDWSTPPKADIRFGNKYSEDTHCYGWNKHHIGHLFSDHLVDDPRRYKESKKFSESEASILLLQYIEDNLKKARREKRRLKTVVETEHNMSGLEYARVVNQRALTYNTEAAKNWRKKVREIKKSPEYLWEQLSK